MKTIHFHKICLIAALGLTSLAAKASNAALGNVIYGRTIGGEMEIVGTTLTKDSVDRTLYVMPGYLTTNHSIIPHHTCDADPLVKIFTKGVFANDDIIKKVTSLHWAPEAVASLRTKAFYNASALEEYTLDCKEYSNGYVADSVFMKSSVRDITIRTYVYSKGIKAGKHFAAETPNLEYCWVSVQSIGEEAFKNSGVKGLSISSEQNFVPVAMCEGDANLERVNFYVTNTDSYLIPTLAVRERAFKGCTSLTTLGEQMMTQLSVLGDYAFDGCPLDDMVWCDMLESIGRYALRGSKFEKAYLSTRIKNLGEGAFAGNENLREVYISNPEPPSIVWDAADPSKCSIPVGVTIYVPAYAVGVYEDFTDSKGEKVWANYTIRPLASRHADGTWEWKGVTYSSGPANHSASECYDVLGFAPTSDDHTLELADGLISYGVGNSFTFFYPDPTKRFSKWFGKDFPDKDKVTAIKGAAYYGTSAFEGSSSIESIEGGTIYANAFKDTPLAAIDGNLYLYQDALRDTPNLQSITTKGNFFIYGPAAFCNSGIPEINGHLIFFTPTGNSGNFHVSTFEDSGLKRLTGPDGETGTCDVPTISAKAFKNSRLEELKMTWPYLTSIKEEAFAGTNLADFDWGDKLTSIGRNAFAGTRFEKIYFPTSLWSIEEGAFAGCEQLTDVWSLAMVPPSIVWDDDNPERCSLPPGITVHTLPEYAKFYQGDPAWKHYIILGDGDTTAIGSVEADRAGKSIRVEEGRIVADGLVEVFTIDGRLLASGYASSLPTLPAGLYIVRTPAATAKIAIRCPLRTAN